MRRTPQAAASTDNHSHDHASKVAQPTEQGKPVRVTEVPRISWKLNLFNAVLMVAVGVPAVLLGWAVCSSSSPPAPVPAFPPDLQQLLSLGWWRSLGYHHPFMFVNAVFFLNVDVLFWLVALVQGTTWLIDPYWTIVPPLIQLFYQFHPRAVSLPLRSAVISTLLRCWSARLTHSYFRRERWQFGAREDWRFTDLSQQVGPHWWWVSFVATYVMQHLMLVGISWPVAAVYSSTGPWTGWDTAAALLAATGICGSWVADTQLHAFMIGNERRVRVGLPPVLLLDTGLWRYSRHPNYFFEQLFWWSLAMFAVSLGQYHMLVGTIFNSLCMVSVTDMTEKRMLRRPERAELFRQYCARTSCWVPLPKRRLPLLQ